MTGQKKPKPAGYDKYVDWKLFIIPVVLFALILALPTPDGMKDVGTEYAVGPGAVVGDIAGKLFYKEMSDLDQWQLLTAQMMERNMRMGALNRERFLKRDLKWCRKYGIQADTVNLERSKNFISNTVSVETYRGMMQQALKLRQQDLTYDTLTVEDKKAAEGREALSLLSQEPDVVVLDIKMPGMSGLEVLDEIRKQRPRIPVIMLTGHGGLPSARKALDKGAFDYLTKPCDANMLAWKITEAVETRKRPEAEDEKRVLGVMVPLKEYTVVNGNQTVREAIIALQASFTTSMVTSRILETGHRSILVTGEDDDVIGILAITDLIDMIIPDYLSSPKPSLADSIQYSPLFWKGMFCKEIRKKAERKVRDVMSPVPLTIDGTASLMEAAYTMYLKKARRLLVRLSGRTAGILREQDLFFEMKRFLED